MLAPLKERAVAENAAAGTSTVTVPPTAPHPADRELEDLRRALRESRARLRRGAWESTRQITALNAEISRLQAACATYRRQLANHESGVVIIELGQKLMRLSENNERLKSAAHRVWTLEKTIEAAHAEYARLSAERDALAVELHSIKLNRFSG